MSSFTSNPLIKNPNTGKNPKTRDLAMHEKLKTKDASLIFREKLQNIKP